MHGRAGSERIPLVRRIDALAAIKSSRFDMPLSYDAGELDLRIGEVVRVPLGSREVHAYVLSNPVPEESTKDLKRVRERVDAPRAFNETGLRLAQFIADRYICTLGEALGAAVLGAALPRSVDLLVANESLDRSRYKTVPPRLLELMQTEFSEGFALHSLLAHPAARRIGDRAALLRYVNAIVRAGDLRRERRFLQPKLHEYMVKVLHPGQGTVRGRKAEALVSAVRDQPGMLRADALLAGYSSAIIARAVKARAVEEREVAPTRELKHCEPSPAAFTPSAQQNNAIRRLSAQVDARAMHEFLLWGVTGSGKTFVYIEVIKHALRKGGRAIVLVPEISLTPQTARRFEDAFGKRVAVLHSALSERERYNAWQACTRGEIDVVVGARSAIFAPLENVRVTVVDEAHETSYKQDSTPRYHAVTVARERMRLEGGVLVLGSATPALESFDAALRGKLEMLELRERATQQPMPSVRIVDMAEEFEAGNRRIFSTELAQALNERLNRREKAVLFVNRRGTASFVLCRACGFVPECPRCSVSLTAHRSERLLRCHYCDFQAPLSDVCTACGEGPVREFGAGTQRVAEEVERLYSGVRVVRMDSDTTTRVGDHARLLDEFAAEGDVLVGTQMVAKGLDFPTVTLVGVVAADIGLHAPDFRASERSFDLITQVCGRSGRARPGEAIVQTYSPKHPAIVYAAEHDYAS
ncbi:MAG: primosomal protein N', partial [Candidatus Eremiobacteraeota bacterium]|nr:primosomal protein N' [Candidatus Eremiobacteraeota bacterium]